MAPEPVTQLTGMVMADQGKGRVAAANKDRAVLGLQILPSQKSFYEYN
jgi:hypothetical protein